jgi:hypothetical protein
MPRGSFTTAGMPGYRTALLLVTTKYKKAGDRFSGTFPTQSIVQFLREYEAVFRDADCEHDVARHRLFHHMFTGTTLQYYRDEPCGDYNSAGQRIADRFKNNVEQQARATEELKAQI